MFGQKRYWISGILAVTTLGLLASAKPLRVFAPELFGLTCPTETICLDDIDRLAQAEELRKNATTYVESLLSPFQSSPRILFCSTEHCFNQFFDPRAKGVNFGTWGMVINATGWQDHIVRHELIHHWQAEQFGVWNTASAWPRWFIEGMAYSLSQDPREVIPNKAAQSYRVEFQDWTSSGGNWRTPDF